MNKGTLVTAITIIFSIFSATDSVQADPFSKIVSAPTAASLSPRSFRMETHLFDGGGIVESVRYGLTGLVDIGVSYGGASMLGSDELSFQPHAGAFMSVRVIEETVKSPAVSIGFDSQGEGVYLSDADLRRFKRKSRGLYLAVSRNYSLLGDFAFHGGANYSFETKDDDSDPSFWIGLTKSIGPLGEIAVEYDAMSNNGEGGDIQLGDGFLNAALKLKLGPSFVIELDAGNLLRSPAFNGYGVLRDDPQPSRELRLLYFRRL